MVNKHISCMIKRIALILCLCLCVCLIAGCSNNNSNNSSSGSNTAENAKTVKVEITPENFKKYFDVSIDVSNQSTSNEDYSFGAKSFDLSGNVSFSIVAKYPCELHDVNFSITATGGTYIGMTNMDEKNLSFTGTIPQSGSYSTSKQVSFHIGASVGDYEIKYYLFSSAINQAGGYIVINSDDQ